MKTAIRASRAGTLLVVAAAAALLLGGCGTSHDSQHATTPEGMHRMSDGTMMNDSDMKPSPSPGSGTGVESDAHPNHVGVDGKPSQSASMVCGEEIQAAVVRTFALHSTPVHSSAWSDHLFRCSYRLPVGGTLQLSVKDLDAEPAGRAYFDHLRAALPSPRTIKGIAAFGFPAFQTRHGDVVFVKDHKTLWVDASRLPAADLPPGFTRTGVAYGVASAVIACWTE